MALSCATTPGTTFEHPLTLDVYAAGGTDAAPTVGALLASSTADFDIPFRPSATPDCPSAGQWRNPVHQHLPLRLRPPRDVRRPSPGGAPEQADLDHLVRHAVVRLRPDRVRRTLQLAQRRPLERRRSAVRGCRPQPARPLPGLELDGCLLRRRPGQPDLRAPVRHLRRARRPASAGLDHHHRRRCR